LTPNSIKLRVRYSFYRFSLPRILFQTGVAVYLIYKKLDIVGGVYLLADTAGIILYIIYSFINT